MTSPEKELEISAEKFLKKIGAEFRKFGNYAHGKYRNKKGTFDWLVSYRNTLIWIEWKIKPNKPSDDQIEFGEWINKHNNGKAVVCYSIEDMWNILKTF